MLLRDLSYRYKIPLRGTALIVATALVVTASLMYRTYTHMKRDLVLHSENMGRIMAPLLSTAMIRDDVWQAFKIINSPFQAQAGGDNIQADVVMLLDAERQVYVSTHPRQMPMLSEPGLVNPEFARLRKAITGESARRPSTIEVAGSESFYVVIPIIVDEVTLGTLIMGYSRMEFLPRFLDIAKGSAVTTLVILAVLLPLAWFWGRRLASPLVQLADCMGRVGSGLPEDVDSCIKSCASYESRDEVGRLEAQFRRMLKELKAKQELERQVLASERLAAIGRLTAGIAHEINNPLGGMLNAVNTAKRHGHPDATTEKTICLLERGLQQIRETVAALLVEAKPQSHLLTPADIEDTRTLVMADMQKKSAQLAWENEVREESLPLPSTLVRQVLINLLLNAAQAAPEKGVVSCRVWRNNNSFNMKVKNNGRHIGAEQMEHLFEPFAHPSETGHGLGLWVTYQIVQQLKGKITAKSRPDDTSFTVVLPLGVYA